MKNGKRSSSSTLKKSIISLMLVLAMMVGTVFGTIAYLTSTGYITNTFTVGAFLKPSDPTDNDKDGDPDNPDDTVSQFIVEPDWVENSQLIPGSFIPKDPHIGIGASGTDGQAAYVFMYINNLMADGVGFAINSGWEAVEGYAEESEVDPGDGKTYYSGGLFRYDASATFYEAEDNMTIGTPMYSDMSATNTDYPEAILSTDKSDAWSAPLFDEVYVSEDIDQDSIDTDDMKMVVVGFIHQADDNVTFEMATEAAIAKIEDFEEIGL